MSNKQRRTWRDYARSVITEVIAQNEDKPIAELRKLISKEYPFGERNYHPYKIWLSEVKNQLAELELKRNPPPEPPIIDLPLLQEAREDAI